VFLGVKDGQRVMLTAYPASVSRLSRKCGILDLSQSYGLPRPVTGIDLPFLTGNIVGKIFVSTVDLVEPGLTGLMNFIIFHV
jgi:hypothetical protein